MAANWNNNSAQHPLGATTKAGWQDSSPGRSWHLLDFAVFQLKLFI